MLADVDQRFLDDTRHLPSQVLRKSDFLELGDERGGDPRLVAELINDLGQGIKELPAVELDRLYSLDQVADAQDLLAQAAVDAPEFVSHANRVDGRLATQHRDLHFYADEGLDDPVVEFARDPGPLHRHGAGTQAAQTVDAVNRRPYLLHQAVKKAQLTLPVSPDARVEEEKATRPLVALA